MILPLICAVLGGLVLGGWLMATIAVTAMSHYSSRMYKRVRFWQEEAARNTRS